MIARAHKTGFLPNRTIALLVVIGAHVAGIYLVSVYGLIRHIVPEPEVPVLRAFVPEVDPLRTQQRPPPQLQRDPLEEHFSPVVQRPNPIFVPELAEPTDIGVRVPIDSGLGAIPEEPRAPIASTPLTYSARRSTDDFYPAASIRLGEEGASVVRVCVGAGGGLQGMPQVTGSSGHARLDAAAVSWVREALVFRPATEDGAAVAACKAFRVTFTLRQ